MNNILLFGPQGSGKGTQGEKLAEQLNLPLVVTGNIFRHHMQEGTELGKLAKRFINKGELVPDEVTNRMIGERIQRADCEFGFILDGYPRNLDQAKALDGYTTITHLLHINISDEEAVQRIGNRRTCVENGHVYHLIYNPPKQEGVCDHDASELEQRADDSEEALKKRLAIYHDETEPLLEFYNQRNLVHDIDGEQSIDDVWKDVKSLF
ncbi:MAG: adenylate kinase [bacterium]|nr:adenylate kinase [bacterium]